ncbi:recombinase family protein [Cellulomonas fimi]|uniref:recombinase family protein n=1 Tax=Cellulomonas fimi TaxID=1708 RepID=UPI00234D945C|nr:recombinase family protein [Cellulomonas fimi]MDC7120282.1 recombinase family protein [Cellulomonas fimi]
MPAPTRTARPRAALYLRLSVAGDEESTSIERQERDLRALAEREEWDIATIYVDDGVSGRTARANAAAAVDALGAGDVDVLAVWKFDRFSREGIRGLVPLLDVLDARPGATFVALQDGLRSGTTAWEVLAPILATFARIESNNTAARVRSAIASNRAAGRWTGGPAPFGYESAPNPHGPGRALVPAPSEAPFMVEAAERVVGGESIYAVVAWLNSTTCRPRRAKSWSLQAVRQVLTGSAIVGRVSVGGEVLRDPEGVPRQVYPPAIPLDLWHATRAALDERTAARKPAMTRARGARSRLLSGIALCAGCGSALYVRQQQNGKPAYRCSSRSNGRPCAAAASVTAERLEEFVADRFLSVVGRFPVVRTVEREPVAVALVESEEALRHTSALLADDSLTDDAADALSARLRLLRTRVRALKAEAAAAPMEVTFEETGETYGDVWRRLDEDVAARRTHLMNALDAVIVSPGVRGRTGRLDPERATIRWRTDADGTPDYLAGQTS